MIQHIGIINHRLHVALKAASSNLYETIQFPSSYLAMDSEKGLKKRKEKGAEFITMKALSGGLITNVSVVCISGTLSRIY